jgi:RHS repeat-associated protein
MRTGAAAVAVAMTASLLLLVPSAPAGAEDKKEARELEALQSAKRPERPPVVPAGDFKHQPPLDPKEPKPEKDHSKSFDPAKSKIHKRTAKADVYDNPDGTQTAVLRTAPVNWQDKNGTWHPIDATLVDDAGRWRNKSARVAVKMAGTSGEGPLAEVAGDGWSVAYDLEGAKPGIKSTAKDDKATYKGLLPDTDLEQRALPEGVKDELIVHKQPAGSDDLVLRYPLTLQGVTAAAQKDGSIAFSTADGTKVAVAPQGVVWDAEKAPAEGGGLVIPLSLVPTTDGGQAMELRVPRSYLADPARRYPVHVDPGLDAGHATWQMDAFGSSFSGNQITNYNGGMQWDGTAYVDMVGYDIFRSSEQYSYQYFDLTPILGKNILDATWRDWVFSVRGSGYFRIWRVASSWSDSTITWNNQPGHAGEYKEGWATAGNFEYMDMTDWMRNWASQGWISKGISLDTAGHDSGVRFAATEQGNTLNEAIYITYNTPPVAGQPTAPDNGAVLMTDQPTLTGSSGSDADGQGLCYWFRVSTNQDGQTGSLLNSGCQGSPTWTPPAGSLIDGMTYYWRMHTFDGTDWAMSDVRSFKVNLRLGRQPVGPMDTTGPSSVNLANGNVVVQSPSRALDTVGGAMGVNYTYNSKAQEQFGLIGTYTSSGNPGYDRLVRRDRQLDFSWGTNSPGPGVPADNFDVTWDGYITIPYETTNWYFGAVHDDDVTIRVNGTEVYSAGCCRESNNPGFGTSLSLPAATVPITVTLHEAGGLAYFQLWTAGPRFGIVPAQWLSTTPPPLPQGWSMSVDAGGGELSYGKAVVGDNSLVLVEPSGAVHEYRKQSDLSWKPVQGDDDVVSTASENGTTVFVVQASDGIVYTFNGKGQLIRAVSATDDRNPAAPVYRYNTTTARLQTIEDPVTLKRIELKYAFPPPGGTTVTTDCPKNSAAGLTKDPPIGMLCQLTYWDGSTTNLYYLGDVAESRVLARIEDPGGEVTDFAYDGNARLTKIREPLAADMVAAGTRANDDTTRTVISYDGSGRASGVRLVSPQAGDPRPEHAYAYPSSTQTDVNVAGLLQPGVFNLARRVTFDAAGRMTSDRDTAGLVANFVWDNEDKLISQTEPGGLKTTTVYDQADRPVESHGPAPGGCFGVAPGEPGWSGERPNSSCSATPVPVARTAYDEGIKGLAAEYWTNANQSGPAALHATGVGDAGGALNANWGTGTPSGLPSGDWWSVRLTGDIAFPQSGMYTLTLCADDGVRLFVDDEKFMEDWIHTARKCRPSSVWSPAPGARRRLRVDFFEGTGDANLTLLWTPPGAGEQVVPGQYLSPRYGLVTSTVDADGKKTSTEYALPEYGKATATVTDPAGLNLRTVTDFEAPGSGFFRRTRRALPKGNATTYAYYGAGESAPSNDCGGVAAVGMLKSETGPTPASGAAITRRFVYDSLHRVVGRKVDGDTRWSCTSYDSRGRTTSTTDSSNKTTTHTYSTPGQVTTTYVDAGGTTRSTIEKTDLLARTWSYQDEHSTTTRRSYDQVGRPAAVFRTLSGGTEKKIVEDAYNSAGRLASSTEWLSDAARTTTYSYDAATGRLTTTTRPNGVATTLGYDANRGDAISASHAGGAMTTSSWTYTKSAARQVNSEATTGRTRSFHYDGAGRLDTTTEGATTRNYAYDANGNRCARATSCGSPTYTYDNADRVTSSPEYSSYTYDGHGNMTQAVPRTSPPPGSLNQTFTLDPANPSSFEIVAGQAGTVSASLDWTGSGPTYTTQTATGSLAASGTKTTAVPLAGMSYVTADPTWTQGTRTRTDSLSGSLGAGGNTTRTLGVTAAGTISASTDWASATKSNNWDDSVPNVDQDDRTITVSANGTVSASLSWPAPAFPNPNPDLNLELLDASGTVVATGTATGANAESLSHNVTGLGAYPATRNYTLRVKAPTLGSSYSLSATWPVTADVDLKLYNPAGTVVAQATGSSAKPEALTHTVASGSTGTYSLKFITKDHATNFTGSASYPTLAHADVTLNLKDPSGTTVATTRSSTGAAALAHRTTSGGTYTLQLVNNSTDVSAPTTSMPWTTTGQASDSWSGTAVPASGTRTKTIALDGDGWVTSDLTWTQGTRTRTDSLSGGIGGPGGTDRTLAVTAPGVISASTDWASSQPAENFSGTVAAVGQSDRTLTASADGTLQAIVRWTAPAFPNPNPDLNVEILDPSGTVVATGTPAGANEEWAQYNVTGMGAYPATRNYTVRVKAVSVGSDFTLQTLRPTFADLDLELYNPSGTRVAQATGSTSKPESLSYTVASGSTGNYTLKVLTKANWASFTGSASYQTLAYADVTLRLKNPSGTTAATVNGGSGSFTLNHRATVGGSWTLELVNNSTDLTIPSFSATTRVPRTQTATTLQLKNAAGTVVAQNTSGDKPKALTTAVTAGRYFLVVTPSGGGGTGTLTATYPGRPGRQVITYDANDHATSVDDGTTLVAETLSPAGRVIRRVVRDSATQDVLEDVLVGYADGGDSPSYTKANPGGTITTYVAGAVYTDTVGTWQLSNLHSDVIGQTNTAGAFTAAPITDEFGVGALPPQRLGWLGMHDRFSVGGSLGLVRMGARLYDPSLGRFTSVDPVEGGCSNDYAYVFGDPVNQTDLTGRMTCDGKWHQVWKRNVRTSPWRTTYLGPGFGGVGKVRYHTYDQARYRCTPVDVVRRKGRRITTYFYEYREEHVVNTQFYFGWDLGPFKGGTTKTVSTDRTVRSSYSYYFSVGNGAGTFV